MKQEDAKLLRDQLYTIVNSQNEETRILAHTLRQVILDLTDKPVTTEKKFSISKESTYFLDKLTNLVDNHQNHKVEDWVIAEAVGELYKLTKKLEVTNEQPFTKKELKAIHIFIQTTSPNFLGAGFTYDEAVDFLEKVERLMA